MGLTKNFHKNGKVAVLRFYPSAGEQPAATIEYDDQGRLRNFSCGAQSVMVAHAVFDLTAYAIIYHEWESAVATWFFPVPA